MRLPRPFECSWCGKNCKTRAGIYEHHQKEHPVYYAKQMGIL